MGRRSGPDITAGGFHLGLIDIRGATEGIAHVDVARHRRCRRGTGPPRRRCSPVLDNARPARRRLALTA